MYVLSLYTNLGGVWVAVTNLRHLRCSVQAIWVRAGNSSDLHMASGALRSGRGLLVRQKMSRGRVQDLASGLQPVNAYAYAMFPWTKDGAHQLRHEQLNRPTGEKHKDPRACVYIYIYGPAPLPGLASAVLKCLFGMQTARPVEWF